MTGPRSTPDASDALDRDRAIAQLELLVQHAPIGIAFLDRDLRFLRVNTVLAEFDGMSVEEHIGRTIHEVLPTLAPTLEPIYRRVLETGERVEDVEVVGETPARPGVERVWLVSYYPVRHADGTVDGVGATVREVTDERLLTARSEQAERLLRDVLERVTDGFVALDSDWRYTYVNAKAGEFFGRRPEDLVGRHIWTEFPEGVGQPFHLAYERAMRDQVMVTFEDYYEPWDRWFENRVYPSPGGISIFFTEITERRRAERVIEREQRRIEALHRIEAAVLAVDEPDQALRSAVAAVRELLHGRMAAVLQIDVDARSQTIVAIDGERSPTSVPGSSGPLPERAVEAFRQGEPVVVADLAEATGGDPQLLAAVRAGAASGLLVPLAGASPLALVVTWATTDPIAEDERMVLREIADTLAIAIRQADLFAAEHRARLAAEALAARVGALQAVTDVTLSDLRTPDLLGELAVRLRAALAVDAATILLVEDGEQLVVAASAGLEEEVGRLRIPIGKGLAGRVAAQRRTIQIDDVRHSDVVGKVTRERLRSMIGTPLMVEDRVIGVVTVGSMTGRTFGPDERELIELAAARAAGAIERARLIDAIDLHAAELEARVEERTRQLTEINEELDAFSYTVSHDLRAPLRAMEGFAAALLEDEGERLSEDGREYAGRIVGAGQRMEALINDLLEYSRVSRASVRLEPVDLDEVAATALRQVEQPLAAAGAAVTAEPALGRVIGHQPTLVQALANLLGNAAKFVAPGSAPAIRVGSERRGPTIRLVVTDNGIGIDEAHRLRIFRVFERLHGQEAYAGTGIGLAIVRKSAERMGGSVGVEPAEGGGSRFWIELPAAGERPGATGPHGDAPGDDGPAPAGPAGDAPTPAGEA